MKTEKKRDKAEKLLEKVNRLAEKIENEPNIAKRTLYSIRAKLVIAKLQRQIDIQEIRQKYSGDREANELEAEESKINSRSEILALNERVAELKKLIRQNELYDSNSPKFVFGREEIERNGGVENYIGILKSSKRPEQISAADKIEYVEGLRTELSKKEKELAMQKEGLVEIDNGLAHTNRTSIFTENALVVKKKANIFERISNFFRNIRDSLKEVRAERRNIREQKIDIGVGEELSKEEALAKAEETYRKMLETIEEQYSDAKDKIKASTSTKQAEDFRNQVREASQKLGYEQPMGYSGDGQPTSKDKEGEKEGEEPQI